MTFLNRAGYYFAVLFLLVYFVATLWPFRWQSPPVRIENGASRDLHMMRFPSAGMIRTTAAPSWLEAAIRQHECAIRLRVRSASPGQSGPARIFTISQDTAHRNLTIAQRGTSLYVRLRSAKTSLSRRPSFHIDDVFATSVWRDIHLVIHHASIHLTVDGKTAVSQRFDGPLLMSWNDQYRLALGNELTGDSTCKICEKTCEWGAIRGPKIVASECVRCDDCERLYMDQAKCPHWLILKRKEKRAATAQ
jgi:hypothetical protein